MFVKISSHLKKANHASCFLKWNPVLQSKVTCRSRCDKSMCRRLYKRQRKMMRCSISWPNSRAREKNHKIRKCTLKSAFTIFAKLTHDGRCWKTKRKFLPSILWIAVPTVLLCFQWAFVALATLPCDWAMHRFPGIWPQNAGYPPSTPPIDFCANGPYCWCLPNVLVIGWLKDPRLGLVSPRPNLGGL